MVSNLGDLLVVLMRMLIVLWRNIGPLIVGNANTPVLGSNLQVGCLSLQSPSFVLRANLHSFGSCCPLMGSLGGNFVIGVGCQYTRSLEALTSSFRTLC